MKMTYNELYHHYYKRIRLCRDIIHRFPDRNHNTRWDTFASMFRYYNDKLRTIDMELGHSTAGGGNYKSQLEESIKPERRNVGNYKSKLK